MAVEIEEGLEDVQHFGHLGEYQHSVSLCLQFPQKAVQRLQFPAIVLNEAGIGELGHHRRGYVVQGGCWFGEQPLDQVPLLLLAPVFAGRWMPDLHFRLGGLHRRYIEYESEK